MKWNIMIKIQLLRILTVEERTEENGQVFNIVDQNLQGFAINGFDDIGSRFVQIDNPIQNFLFLHQITCKATPHIKLQSQ